MTEDKKQVECLRCMKPIYEEDGIERKNGYICKGCLGDDA